MRHDLLLLERLLSKWHPEMCCSVIDFLHASLCLRVVSLDSVD